MSWSESADIGQRMILADLGQLRTAMSRRKTANCFLLVFFFFFSSVCHEAKALILASEGKETVSKPKINTQNSAKYFQSRPNPLWTYAILLICLALCLSKAENKWGSVYTTPLLLRLGLPSSIIRHKNGAFKIGGIWKRRLFVFKWTENTLKTGLFDKDDNIMWFP